MPNLVTVKAPHVLKGERTAEGIEDDRPEHPLDFQPLKVAQPPTLLAQQFVAPSPVMQQLTPFADVNLVGTG